MGRRELRGFNPEALAARREKLGMARQDVARLAEVSTKTIWSWETGAKSPQIDRLARVAKALRTTPAAFIAVPKGQRTLADLRAMAGLTQPQLARDAGMSTTALQDLERAETRLTDHKAELLAHALGLTPEIVRAAYERARVRPPGAPA